MAHWAKKFGGGSRVTIIAPATAPFLAFGDRVALLPFCNYTKVSVVVGGVASTADAPLRIAERFGCGENGFVQHKE